MVALGIVNPFSGPFMQGRDHCRRGTASTQRRGSKNNRERSISWPVSRSLHCKVMAEAKAPATEVEKGGGRKSREFT
jgi:hypothetical protein